MIEAGDKLSLAKSYVLVLVVWLALYVVTMAPGALWQDSGMYQYRIWNNDIEGNLGIALAHPLYHLIGIAFKYIPVGEFAWRVNLISAIFGAVTVANVFLLLRLAVKKIVPAVVGAMSLGFSWTFWQHSAIAEVYVLYTAIFTAELIFVLKYVQTKKIGYLYWLGLFNGLSIANHNWGFIALACFTVWWIILLAKKQIHIKNIFIIVLLWMAGAVPYEYLIIKNLVQTGNLSATIASALFGNSFSNQVLNTSLTSRTVLENILFIGYNFPTPNIILFIAGLIAVYKIVKEKTFANMLAAITILFFVFAFRYKVPDRYAFFVPFYCLFSIFIGLGSFAFLEKFTAKEWPFLVVLFALFTIPVYMYAPAMAEKANISLGVKRQIPYRNDYTYFLQPWQMDNDGPRRFATEALREVDLDSVILADGTTVYALWYVQQLDGLRKDAAVVSAHGSYESPIPYPDESNFEKLFEEKTIYVVSPVKGYCPQFVLDKYDFEKTGVLYRVVERQALVNQQEIIYE
ncbi:MAG: DUF2723 domain-containing protein [Phycisphaerae bacterium]|nr:DUF2723 domain-containing protein [Phycisphaerae bacterium]